MQEKEAVVKRTTGNVCESENCIWWTKVARSSGVARKGECCKRKVVLQETREEAEDVSAQPTVNAKLLNEGVELVNYSLLK